MAEIAALLVGDPPQLWDEIGFALDDDSVWVSGVRHVLGGDEPGVRDWSIRGLTESAIDGLALGLPVDDAKPTPDHRNGVIALDHVVLSTPDLGRTIAAIEDAGVELRRIRDAGTEAARMQQAFFKFGEVILEVVGPTRPRGDGPPRLYGLAYTVADLDATAAALGPLLRPAKDAVQPGRRIATLDRAAGSTVPIAFMTPEPARAT